MPTDDYDVVIIGGGPAGMNAAATLAEHSVRTLLIDEKGRLGGQLWRDITEPVTPSTFTNSPNGKINLSITKGYRDGSLHIQNHASVLGIFPDKSLLLSTEKGGIKEIKAQSIVFATGAREKVRPFEGWTLPEVMTVGGAQILLKDYNVLAAPEMLVSGTGPLLYLLCGDTLSRGGRISALLDRSSFMSVLGVTRLMRGQLSKLGQGLSSLRHMLKAKIVPHYRRQITRAASTGGCIEVTTQKIGLDGTFINGSSQHYKTQMIAVTNGFVGNIELPQIAGCQLDYSIDKGGWSVTVDSSMETSVSGMFAAGEITGVAGGHKAMVEGQLAALSILHQADRISTRDFENKRKPLLVNHARYQRFGAYLNRQWAIPRKEWDTIDDNTIICRCEDITLGTIRSWIKSGFSSPSVLKRATRCGMGNCQGRTCGPLVYDILAAYAPTTKTEELFSVRIPVKPVSLGALAQMHSR